MFSFRTTSLFEQPDLILNSGKVAVFCNQTAWYPLYGKYLFEILYSKGTLKRVFTPEEGLFREFAQDDCEFLTICTNDKGSLNISSDKLSDIDAIIIDLQDVGSRHISYNSTIYALFKILKAKGINLSIFIIDHENPAGRQVEGTMLKKGCGSPVSVEGTPHRHGLTIGEMAHFLHNSINARFPLHIISYMAESARNTLLPCSISPSPNIPGLFTPHFYCGQYLWEGTNVSNGVGTIRPYELFGAPFIKSLINYNRKEGYQSWNDSSHPISDPSVYLRWTKFTPRFDKYKDEVCFGFQLHLLPGVNYHALAHNLKIMNFMAKNCKEFSFAEEAILLLLGDKMLNSYVKGDIGWEDIWEHIKLEEQKWIRKVRKALLYETPLFRSK